MAENTSIALVMRCGISTKLIVYQLYSIPPMSENLPENVRRFGAGRRIIARSFPVGRCFLAVSSNVCAKMVLGALPVTMTMGIPPKELDKKLSIFCYTN